MNDTSLLQRIRTLGNLTKSESKIAALFEKEYQYLAFETIQTISEKAAVGKATVSRFIARLGYGSFSAFMDCIKKEVVARLDTPIERWSARKESGTAGDVDYLGRQMEFVFRNLEEMRARIDPADIRKAARLIASARGTLYVMGAATSQGLAYFFHMLAMYLRERVVLLDANPSALAHKLIDASGDDILVAILHHRFSAQTVEAARCLSERGARIVLVSDRELTPVSNIATIQLVAFSESPSMFNSRCGTLLILESIIAAMVPLLERQVYERFGTFEDLRGRFATFVQGPVPSRDRTEDSADQ